MAVIGIINPLICYSRLPPFHDFCINLRKCFCSSLTTEIFFVLQVHTNEAHENTVIFQIGAIITRPFREL